MNQKHLVVVVASVTAIGVSSSYSLRSSKGGISYIFFFFFHRGLVSFFLK